MTYPQLEHMADIVSRNSLDHLRDFKTDVKALSQRIGRVRSVRRFGPTKARLHANRHVCSLRHCVRRSGMSRRY